MPPAPEIVSVEIASAISQSPPRARRNETPLESVYRMFAMADYSEFAMPVKPKQ
jgi:hypothetical protein